MHMLYDDEQKAFSGIILHAGQHRNIQVFIPTDDAPADFAACYARFKRLSTAPELICEQIQQSLDAAPDESVYSTLCLLQDSLKESRFRFGQEAEGYSPEKYAETEAWIEQFAETVEHLKAASPAEFKHHLYCHHLNLGDESAAVFRLHNIDLDVFVTELHMAHIDQIMARLHVPAQEGSPSRSQLH
ncbi:hypothetical protein [Pseudomonas sp. Leaf58]|uniref:hypothetical protein n=1 Tax=Pseudomonas sp. Leaf58 TaxID=1736226 RepID=UPI000A981D5A|nr:hypothetical protein [Pseudomonas sp. Leaf58]